MDYMWLASYHETDKPSQECALAPHNLAKLDKLLKKNKDYTHISMEKLAFTIGNPNYVNSKTVHLVTKVDQHNKQIGRYLCWKPDYLELRRNISEGERFDVTEIELLI